METLNKADIHKLNEKETKLINGGALKGWGWLGVAAYIAGEITDYVTSNGGNIEEAYQNGYEAGLE